jgi:hypothetical protein
MCGFGDYIGRRDAAATVLDERRRLGLHPPATSVAVE